MAFTCPRLVMHGALHRPSTTLALPSSLGLRLLATTAVTPINCHRTSVARVGRLMYTRQYPTIVVLSDGSTINLRYHEPRKIIKLPLDMTTLSEAERRRRLEMRKPRTKVVLEDDLEEDFNLDEYKHLWKP